MAENKKYLDYDGLAYYNEKIKAYLDSGFDFVQDSVKKALADALEDSLTWHDLGEEEEI